LQSGDGYTIPTLADRIRNELQRQVDQPNPDYRHEYCFWYTLAVERGLEDELGSAMILSTQSLPPKLLRDIRGMLDTVYSQMRNLEMRIGSSMPPPDPARVAGPLPRASELDVAQWKTLRAKARSLLPVIGLDHLERRDFLWAHHVAGGGQVDPTTVRLFTDVFETYVCPDLIQESDLLSLFPKTNWNSLVRTALPSPNDETAPWERPPLRALAQFDSDPQQPQDLSIAFMLLHSYVPEVIRSEDIAVEMRFLRPAVGDALVPAWPIHDYLWFNVSKVGLGLIRLLRGLAELLGEEKKRQKTRSQEPGNVVYTRARVEWILRECCDDSFRGMELTVAQYFMGRMQLDQVEPTHSLNVFDVPYPLPNPNLRVLGRKVGQAYKLFREAGARISRTEIGTLQIKVPATLIEIEPHKEVWEVTACP
jgi:hypothetical protein